MLFVEEYNKVQQLPKKGVLKVSTMCRTALLSLRKPVFWPSLASVDVIYKCLLFENAPDSNI